MSFTTYLISDTVASQSLSRDTVRRLSGFVIAACMLFAVSAILFFSCLISNNLPAFCLAGAAFCTVLVTFYVLKHGKPFVASYMVLAALCAAAISGLCTMPPNAGSSCLFYSSALLSAMVACAYGCSFLKRQLYIMCGIAIVLFCCSAFSFFSKEHIPQLVLSFAELASVILFVVRIYGVSDSAVKEINKAENEAGENFSSLSRLVSEAKEFFTLGLRLQTETENAQNSLDELSEFYNYLIRQADDLTASISVVKKAGITVKEQTDKISTSVQEQNLSITQTSAAMTEIAATLRSISNIAGKRRIMMNTLVDTFNDQQKLLGGLISCINDVRASSEVIAGFVDTVDDIAARTGLLAMNASIEAAHAGVAGKGFAVIAHEIRNLSEQTSANAAKISEALKHNAVVVAGTADTAGNFGDQIKHTTNELNSTAVAMEEILSGISEMNNGTQDIMRELQNIVEHSHISTELVSAVVSEVTGQSAATEQMTSFADALQQRVMSLEMLVGLIQMVITNIKLEAERTTEMSKGISTILDTNAVQHNIMDAVHDPIVTMSGKQSQAQQSLLTDIFDAADIVPSGQPPVVPIFERPPEIAVNDAASVSKEPRPPAPPLPGEEIISLDDFLN